MKAESTIMPSPFDITVTGDDAEIRFRENAINLPPREDEPSGTERWEYDEYVLRARNRPQLFADISANTAAWLWAAKNEEYRAIADDVRAERDRLLAKSDWTQAADNPLSMGKRDAWQKYRQALRDIPQQNSFPWEVNWPGEIA